MKITQEMAMQAIQEMQVVGTTYPQSTEQHLNTLGGSSDSSDVKVEIEDWIKREVGRGLYMVLAQRLPYSPRMNEIQTLTQAWSFVFKRRLGVGVAVEEIDAPRIQEAFCRAMDLDKWPAAAQVADLMPRRPERPAVPHLPKHTPHGFAELKKIQRMLER